MEERKVGKVVFSLIMVGLLVALAATEALAVPSFHRQTGQDCKVCHTMFPELTPTGRVFKVTGYVINKTMSKCPPYPPVAGMAQVSYTHSSAGVPGLVDRDLWSRHSFTTENDNNVVGSPQQLSVFYGGQIYDKLGAFVQATYANDTSKDGFPMAMDLADIRYANSTQLFESDLIFGITVNNNPTVEDLWNSTPVWGFPWAGSNFAPTPAASTLIDGGLGAQVGGAGLYAYWNNFIYAAVTVYRTSENGITYPFGAGNHALGVQVDGALPYWRLALTHQIGTSHSIEIGTYGLIADTFPGNPPADPFLSYIRTGPTDHFRDLALDAQYQYIQGKHSFSLQTTLIHERQNLTDGTFAQGGSANQFNSLHTFKINGNYFYRTQNCGAFGGSGGIFSTTGSVDTVLYAPAPVSGSLNGSPDSNGFILELDYLPPWKYLYTKLSMQYVIYNKFNGAGSNYDGFGRNASDNNTLYLLLWTAF